MLLEEAFSAYPALSLIPVWEVLKDLFFSSLLLDLLSQFQVILLSEFYSAPPPHYLKALPWIQG